MVELGRRIGRWRACVSITRKGRVRGVICVDFRMTGGGGGVYEDRVDERVAEWIADEWGCGGTAGGNAEHSEAFTVGGSAERGGEAGAEAGAAALVDADPQRSGAVD